MRTVLVLMAATLALGVSAVRADDLADFNQTMKTYRGFAIKLPGTGVFVNANDKTFTDKEMQLLRPWKELGKLGLDGTSVTEAAAKEVAGFKNLKELVVVDSPVGDKFVREVAAHPGMTRLTLRKTQITDAALRDIAKMKNLTELEVVESPKVVGWGVKELGGLTELTKVNLAATKVTNEGIFTLAKLSKLETLDLSNNPGLGDAGLRGLAGAKRLRTMNVFGTKVTAKGAAELKKALPECEIRGFAP